MVLADGLTTTEAIRAVLGASADAKEFVDDALLDLSIEQELIADIDSWLPDGTSRASIIADGEHAEMSTIEARTYFYLRAYSKYHCAWLLAPALWHALLSRVSDGQNDVRRHTPDMEDLLDRLKGLKDDAKEKLDGILGVEATAFSLFSGVGDAYDPVTGKATV